MICSKEDWSRGDLIWSRGDLLQIRTKEDQWSPPVRIKTKKSGVGNKDCRALVLGEEKEVRAANGKEGLSPTKVTQARPQPKYTWSLPAPVMIEVDMEVKSGPDHETRYHLAIVTPHGSPRELPKSTAMVNHGEGVSPDFSIN
jgi:hypothetical protein